MKRQRVSDHDLRGLVEIVGVKHVAGLLDGTLTCKITKAAAKPRLGVVPLGVITIPPRSDLLRLMQHDESTMEILPQHFKPHRQGIYRATLRQHTVTARGSCRLSLLRFGRKVTPSMVAKAVWDDLKGQQLALLEHLLVARRQLQDPLTGEGDVLCFGSPINFMSEALVVALDPRHFGSRLVIHSISNRRFLPFIPSVLLTETM